MKKGIHKLATFGRSVKSKIAVTGAALVGTAAVANAAPVDVDPTDAIAQLTATFSDVLPFVMLVISLAVAVRYAKRWMS